MKYIFLKNFFYQKSAERLNKKIKDINEAALENYNAAVQYLKLHSSLKEARNDEYSIPKMKITNSYISAGNHTAIGLIRNFKLTSKNVFFISDSLAEDIVENVVLKSPYQRYMDDKKKIEYENVEEVFWGTYEEIKQEELIFFYVICRDMLNSEEYRQSMENILKDYIPYAVNLAYRDINFEEEFERSLYERYFTEIPLDRVDEEQLKAIVRLYAQLIQKNIDITKLFFEQLEEVEYWSTKSTEEEYKSLDRVKHSSIGFKKADIIFKRFIDEHLLTILKDFEVQPSSFGLRVYSIIRNDFLEFVKLFDNQTQSQDISNYVEILENAELLVSNGRSYAQQLAGYQLKIEATDLVVPTYLNDYKQQLQDKMIDISSEIEDSDYQPIEVLLNKYRSQDIVLTSKNDMFDNIEFDSYEDSKIWNN